MKRGDPVRGTWRMRAARRAARTLGVRGPERACCGHGATSSLNSERLYHAASARRKRKLADGDAGQFATTSPDRRSKDPSGGRRRHGTQCRIPPGGVSQRLGSKFSMCRGTGSMPWTATLKRSASDIECCPSPQPGPPRLLQEAGEARSRSHTATRVRGDASSRRGQPRKRPLSADSRHRTREEIASANIASPGGDCRLWQGAEKRYVLLPTTRPQKPLESGDIPRPLRLRSGQAPPGVYRPGTWVTPVRGHG